MSNQKTLNIVVGTTNEFKIECVDFAFKMIPFDVPYNVSGITMNSYVNPQPMSDEEGMLGASIRASEVKNLGSGDIGIGIEGVIQKVRKSYFVSDWVALAYGGIIGYGCGTKVRIPNKLMNVVLEEKKELGIATAHYYRRDEKIITGVQDIFTRGLSTRRDGIIAATLAAYGDHWNQNFGF